MKLDPRKVTVPFAQTRVPLSDLAHARDFVRQSHMALDPFPMADLEVRDSKAGGGQFTIRGHAAVFDRRSHDLGGFTEIVRHGFFDDVLEGDPDVHAYWDHDPGRTLARTRNKTLELRVDPMGLHNWMRVAPTSYAQDLRILMERGDVDQQSFAFTVSEDEWEQDEESGAITRYLIRADGLYDVTVTAQGAYPQTGAEVVRSMRSVLDADRTVFAVGFEDREASAPEPEADIDAAPEEEAVETPDAVQDLAAVEDEAPHEEEVAADSESELALRDLKAKAEQRSVELARLKERLKAL